MNPYGYWEYPYNVVDYWAFTEKYKKKKRLYSPDAYKLESMVLDMTQAMKWMLKVYKKNNLDMFYHDYYEVADERKELLEIFKKYRPEDYELFVESNPKVLVYEEYDDEKYKAEKKKEKEDEKKSKKPKAPQTGDN